jgi:hypothetical protein
MTEPPEKAIEDFDLSDVIQRLSQQADSSYAMMLGSHLEDWLRGALLAHMQGISNTLKEDIFSGYGPLSSFSAKIDVAYALGIVPQSLHQDMKAIKGIRNKFAHARTALHFNSPELAPDMQRLTGWSRDAEPYKLFTERFDACMAALKAHLDRQDLIKAILEYQADSPDAAPDKSPLQQILSDSPPDGSGTKG